MKKLSEILLSAAMAAAAPAALAQDKPNTYVDGDMKTRVFDVSQEPHEDGITLIGGISDDVVGILCKWRISGGIDFDTRRAAAQVEKHSCSATEKTPDSWLGGKLLQDDKFFPSRYETVPLGSNPSVIEMRIGKPHSDGTTSTYARVWDFAKSEVCIRHYQGQYVGNSLNIYVNMENGCHTMPQGRHADRMREKLDPKWSSLKVK